QNPRAKAERVAWDVVCSAIQDQVHYKDFLWHRRNSSRSTPRDFRKECGVDAVYLRPVGNIADIDRTLHDVRDRARSVIQEMDPVKSSRQLAARYRTSMGTVQRCVASYRVNLAKTSAAA